MNYYNREGTNVTRQIETGRTEVFETRTDAIEFAKENNSYVYDLMCQQKHEKRPSFYGYAVPK